MTKKVLTQGFLGIIGLSAIGLAAKLYFDVNHVDYLAYGVATQPYSYSRLVEMEKNKKLTGRYFVITETGGGVPRGISNATTNVRMVDQLTCLKEDAFPVHTQYWVSGVAPEGHPANSLAYTREATVASHFSLEGLTTSFMAKALPFWDAWIQPVAELEAVTVAAPNGSENCRLMTEHQLEATMLASMAYAASTQQDTLSITLGAETATLRRTSAYGYAGELSADGLTSWIGVEQAMTQQQVLPWSLHQETFKDAEGRRGYVRKLNYSLPGPDELAIDLRSDFEKDNISLQISLVPKQE